ncbi:MAG: N-acetylglucosamine-6-phosphate deacetylase [Ruminococcaceae bacterium]|nr:N-acetylglucosamine-6-phosphate deacetylase [Oscillospiraceae bacterium]
MKRIRSDKIILENGIFDGFIYFEDGKITALTDKELPFSEEYDMTGFYVSAGFIDIHTHGGGGYRFEGSVDEIVNGCNFHLNHGTTSICPTISADAFDTMAASVERVRAAMSDPRIKGTVIGTHLEGPYLSKTQAGAQCPAHITEPIEKDYLPLIEKDPTAIARWSYAPENDKDGRFAKALSEHGIVASAGHTDAIYPDMLRAFENGCALVTHLYSCTSTITRDHGFRRLGVIESAYLLDDIYVEIICDGKHLPPELIKLIYKIKGADRIALITDSLALAGTEQTHGKMQHTEFIIEDGVCKLMDRSAFAGSIATADRLVRVAVKEAGIPLHDAIKMITATPARIMKLHSKGIISPDMDADFAVFDENIAIKNVFAKGNLIGSEL